MVTARTSTSRAQSIDADPRADERVFLYNVPWSQYEALLEVRGDASVPRFTYVERMLEIMTPSWEHDDIKTTIARLFEAYVDELDLPCTGLGSWTIKSKKTERGAEPDECYIRRDIERDDKATRPSRPDIAIEVIWTRGGFDKREVWKELGVPELWMWRDGVIEIHALEEGEYVRREGSAIYPEMDVGLIEKMLDAKTQRAAVSGLRELLRRGSASRLKPKRKAKATRSKSRKK